jgi:hypothetical protein
MSTFNPPRKAFRRGLSAAGKFSVTVAATPVVFSIAPTGVKANRIQMCAEPVEARDVATRQAQGPEKEIL